MLQGKKANSLADNNDKFGMPGHPVTSTDYPTSTPAANVFLAERRLMTAKGTFFMLHELTDGC